ncbi:hypothetical protein PCASD_00586 [Puccinia coronata f. sp. avenae]|uniref:Uncharacterized protein n=1 Tax=Puccinia coronata f. sp. avenae TaxID=200324 RepID=A0A2N5VNY6_9BASI|nr:hypothetical protein PCASD_00586 [Puccinia coronata f. sp. avenae]
MNNLNIAPNLENYHLDENGRILLTNSNHTSNDHQFGFGASTQHNFDPLVALVPTGFPQAQFATGTHTNQDQSLNGAHNEHGTDPQIPISSPAGAHGRGCGRGRGRGGGSGRGRASKNNSLRGGQRKVTFAEQLDEGQTATVAQSSQPNQNDQSSQSNPTTQSSQTPSGQQAEARIDLNNRISQGSADVVRQVSFATGKGRRLTNRIKDELKHFKLEYQKKIHELAITYELRSEILFKWVGGFNKMKGPNRFNNYYWYGREPREIFASKQFPPGERMQQVGEKWQALDESEQLKYTDIDFLNDLRKAMGLPGTVDPEDIKDEDCEEAGHIDAEFNQSADSGNLQIDLLASKVKVQQASKSGAEALKVCKKWVNQVTEDFNHMRADHQVEGFVIAVSSDSLGSVFLSGGTPLGEEYMDMLKAKYECWKKFHIWVTGMTVDGELNPLGRPIKKLPKHATNSAQAKPWEAGEVPDKKKIMREHLRIMLFLKIKLEAVEPSTGVNLWKTLLDGDPSAYSKDQIHAVLEALHFKWILLSKKDPATATGTDSPTATGMASRGLQGTGSEQREERSTAEGNEADGDRANE